MTNDQINQRIADACGWRKEEGFYVWHNNGIDRTCWGLWDWCNDLNAMHEAENCLSPIDRDHYIDYLREMFGDSWAFALATARQRAEAFLRTLGKWEETE